MKTFHKKSLWINSSIKPLFDWFLCHVEYMIGPWTTTRKSFSRFAVIQIVVWSRVSGKIDNIVLNITCVKTINFDPYWYTSLSLSFIFISAVYDVGLSNFLGCVCCLQLLLHLSNRLSALLYFYLVDVELTANLTGAKAWKSHPHVYGLLINIKKHIIQDDVMT